VTILARPVSATMGSVVVLCLTGDVLTGRGVDQILPAAGDPRLWEPYAASAEDYVALAEATSGPIPQPVDFSWPWGDAMQVLDELAPDLRIVNQETSITSSDDFQPAKAVLYRMHPGNVACLTAARLDACALANNHVLDFGIGGLEETLDVRARAWVRWARDATSSRHGAQSCSPPVAIGSWSGRWGRPPAVCRTAGRQDRTALEWPSSASTPTPTPLRERVRR